MIPDKLLVFGAGNHARKLASALTAHGSDVGAFVTTHNTSPGLIEGIPVYSLTAIPYHLASYRAIACGVLNEFDSHYELEKLLREKGFSHIVWPQQYYPVLHDAMGWCYWLDSQPLTLSEWKEHDSYKSLFLCLEDDESKEVLDRVLSYRSGHELSYSSYISADPQYFNELSLPEHLTSRSLSYLDVGAYTGDSIVDLCSICEVGQSVLLEPELTNFSRLIVTLKDLIAKYPSTKLLALPLGAGCDLGSFPIKGGGAGASIHGLHATQVDSSQYMTVVSLDDILLGQYFDFIKVDVEGHDLDVIKGLASIIRKSKPVIACSVYHRPRDVFDIPLCIKDLLGDLPCRYYLRQHSVNSFDLIFYAVPDGIGMPC